MQNSDVIEQEMLTEKNTSLHTYFYITFLFLLK